MIFHKNISEIAHKYDCFILDLWGVIHDGSKVYPDVVERLEYLKNLGKKICLLSNAPRRSFKVVELLRRLEIQDDLYDFIVTSGEATYSYFKENFDRHSIGLPQKNIYNYYYIGPKKDADLLDGLGYVEVAEGSLADFAITTGFDDGNYNVEEKIPQLRDALQNNLTLICSNPDLIVVKQSGEEMLCAGVLALEYQKMGGKVIYFGKPYNLVYEQVLRLFSSCDRARILAVGDGMTTDIIGANNNQIDSVLIAGGILANELGVSHGELPNYELTKEICNKYQAYPTFVAGSF